MMHLVVWVINPQGRKETLSHKRMLSYENVKSYWVDNTNCVIYFTDNTAVIVKDILRVEGEY